MGGGLKSIIGTYQGGARINYLASVISELASSKLIKIRIPVGAFDITDILASDPAELLSYTSNYDSDDIIVLIDQTYFKLQSDSTLLSRSQLRTAIL
jgi:hypothetical protein